MERLLQNLRTLLPNIVFEPGNTFFWSPENSRITYKKYASDDKQSAWALLHEASHALLGHRTYHKDFELLRLEISAWEKAVTLGKAFKLRVDDNHIQDCLDTYRDWLHQRSTCPRCGVVSFQVDNRHYKCHNCSAAWQVSNSRFCRPYRMQKRRAVP